MVFVTFRDFGMILGIPGPSKNWKKVKKIQKYRFFNAFSFEGGFWEGSGRVIMRGAVKVAELTLMIRATRGRSMDGEDLIICVAIWTLNKL